MSEHASTPILRGPALEGLEQYDSVTDVFHSAVKRFAQKPAFTCMGKTLSFADLDRLSADFAAWLQHETDLEPGDRIAIQLPNVLQFPVAVFGALRAGLVVVNTNPLYTEREMAHQFKDSNAKAILILANMADKLEKVLDKTDIKHVLVTQLGAFYRLHNQAGPHFALDMRADTLEDTGWKSLLPPREDATLEGVDAFAWGLVVAERSHQEAQVRLRQLSLAEDGHTLIEDHYLALPGTPVSQLLEDMPHFDARTLHLREESFTHPPRWFALNLDSGERTLLKQVPVHGSLSPEQLVSRRIWATSHDGEQVPVSVVMRADLVGQPLPTLLYGYGAYGEALDPWFSIARLELLERGVAFAVAHVRGGGERGEPWYLAGKMANKENSFHDFLAAREALVSEQVSQPERIVACGASAGGLLVGTCLNRAPEAFCAAVLDVPFLDVLRTMQNPELPLTTAEYTEWGNPESNDVRERIAGYSPVDNIRPQRYPALWVEGSWFDTRVSYWEPAKFYARVTQAQQGSAPILLHTDMTSGHGGASGRFKAWRDAARQDAFILWALGLVTRPK